jgi:hypothetical protein
MPVLLQSPTCDQEPLKRNNRFITTPGIPAIRLSGCNRLIVIQVFIAYQLCMLSGKKIQEMRFEDEIQQQFV